MPGKLDQIEARCDCNRMHFVISRRGIEIKCGKCGKVRIWKWRQLLEWILDILPEESETRR